MIIHPVILCGGSGTRLWPLSRQSYPKQFSPLFGKESLFQQTAKRLSGPAYAAPVIVTASAFRFIVAEQLEALGISPAAILIEPDPRNTGPAVLAAAFWLARIDPDAMMLVAPSDHLIPDAADFSSTVQAALATARSGELVTFGIAPTRAETGYGYLELEIPQPTAGQNPIRLRRFVEKPPRDQAIEMFSSGRHLWNAGIFLFTVPSILRAYHRHAPDIVPPVSASVDRMHHDLGFLRLDPDSWSTAPTISIDYAIMEREKDLWVMPYHGAWSDLGGWETVWTESSKANDGTATHGTVLAVGCTDSLLRSEDTSVQLVAIGVRDLIAVAMPDAMLVADKSRAQDVRLAVEALRTGNARQADAFPREHRPWGHFESLVLAKGFQVKRIVVNPGAALSLQSHNHRAEHWVVVEGEAEVTLDSARHHLQTNQSIYIPKGAKHRLANPGIDNLTVIEVQSGAYLGEDDIIRHEDVYARR